MPSDLNAEQRNKILRLALAGYLPGQIAERLCIPEGVVKRFYPGPPKPKVGFQKGNKHGRKGWKKNEATGTS